MSGSKAGDVVAGFWLLVIMLVIYIAGLFAFYYLKTRKPPRKKEPFYKIFYRESIVAFWVSFAMVCSSGIGVIFFDGDFKSFGTWLLYIYPYATSFFFEALLALIWLSYIFLWEPKKKWLRTLVAWIGMFVIFIIIFVFTNSIMEMESFINLYNYIIDYDLILEIKTYFISTLENAYYLSKSPDMFYYYLIDSLKSSGGNQFILIEQFPLWSLFFIGFALIRLSLESTLHFFNSN